MLIGALPWRLRAQRLTGEPAGGVAELVGRLGAVQAQLPDQAWWGLAQRLDGLSHTDALQAFDRGEVVRTHLQRATWHFVLPEDLGWMLRLTQPRVRRQIASVNRSIGLTEADVERGAQIVVDQLDDGSALTRPELAPALVGAGLPATGTALAHHVMTAEVAGLIVSGPMRGRQPTYMATRQRIPRQPTVTEDLDELLARLARRYAVGHGPFEPRDLAWWSGLTLGDARRAVELAQLVPADVAGRRMWSSDEVVQAEPVPPVLLLPNFDEIISYHREPEDVGNIDLLRGAGLVLVEGRIVAGWSRVTTATRVRIRTSGTAGRPVSVPRPALQEQLRRLSQFWERPADLDVTHPTPGVVAS